ncbi:glycine cleavage system aminomethyltransferase GcvT [Tepidibacillus marianensis]|uniref:glycine cleavage system aminomethyltransferase GcvT n=1 Tax=Tepidibacillus marianensis TaxID=3131995 RepID=UPI0030D0136D
MIEGLKRTSLFPVYQKYGAKLIDFGGWELPVQFSGILEEHKAVRQRAGLFDVSHMGEVDVKGKDALHFIQKVITNDASKLIDGKVLYSPMCYSDGGTVDDLLVYRYEEDHYLVVINAANIDKDVAWLVENKEGEVELVNISGEVCQLALQGPLAAKTLQKISNIDLSIIEPFHFKTDVELRGIKALVSRTGYTGEDGFEIYLSNDDAPKLYDIILEIGKEDGVIPCGLGARDTLRFEAKLPLYGQELSPTISPIEAGIGFFVKWDKGDFIGRDALLQQKENGAPRKIVGVEMVERGIPRAHYPVYVGDEQIGEITTGTQSPTLKKNLGLALIKTEYAALGNEVWVEIRNKKVKAQTVKTPFYKRGK